MSEDNDSPHETHDDTVRDGKSLLDFQLDKTHAAFFEAGKRHRVAFLLAVSLLTLSLVLVFGVGIQGDVSVPLLGLKLNRLHAAEATFVLFAAAFYSWMAILMGERMLDTKLRYLLYKRYGKSPSIWSVSYPSITTISGILMELSLAGKAVGLVPALLFPLSFAASVAVGVGILVQDLSWHAVSASVLAAAFLVGAALIYYVMPTPDGTDEAREVLSKIED